MWSHDHSNGQHRATLPRSTQQGTHQWRSSGEREYRSSARRKRTAEQVMGSVHGHAGGARVGGGKEDRDVATIIKVSTLAPYTLTVEAHPAPHNANTHDSDRCV